MSYVYVERIEFPFYDYEVKRTLPTMQTGMGGLGRLGRHLAHESLKNI